jgi:YggT family protein
MNAFLRLVDNIVTLYIWLLILAAVMSWLISFNVINTRNRLVYTVADFLYRVTEPALRPIRRYIPSLGGIDISPVVLILALWFIRDLLFEILAP